MTSCQTAKRSFICQKGRSAFRQAHCIQTATMSECRAEAPLNCGRLLRLIWLQYRSNGWRSVRTNHVRAPRRGSPPQEGRIRVVQREQDAGDVAFLVTCLIM